MLSQRNFKPDNPSSLFPVRRLLHSTHPKWTPDRIGYAGLLSSLKIQVPRCVEVDYFESSFPRHLTLATCLETKIRPPPSPQRAKSTRKLQMPIWAEKKKRSSVTSKAWREWFRQKLLSPAYSRRQKEALFTVWNGKGLLLISHQARESGILRLRIHITT